MAMSPVCLQVALLWDGQERGRMYGAYALSAMMTPQSPVDGLLAAGVIPALVAVLNTSRVRAPGSSACLHVEHTAVSGLCLPFADEHA